MIIFEVRSFDGSPEELSQFVVEQWTASYRGKMAVPRWGADYLRWQLRMDEPRFRRHLIAAYDGTRLVGAVCHFPMRMSLLGETFESSEQSWLSVAPAYRRLGVGNAMITRSMEIHRERGCRFKVGFTYYGRRASLGPKFWLKSQMENSTIIYNAGFWVRVIDPVRSANWNVDRFEAFMTRMAAPLFPTLRSKANSAITIRSVEGRDVPRCVELIRHATEKCPLRLVWDDESLSRNLGLHGFSRALVAEENGQLRGFISFHILPMLGQIEAPVGVIDLIAVSLLSSKGCTQLLNAVLVSMKQRGAIIALKLRTGDYPSGLFLRLGWFLRPADSHLILRWMNDPQPLPRFRKVHVLWR